MRALLQVLFTQRQKETLPASKKKKKKAAAPKGKSGFTQVERDDSWMEGGGTLNEDFGGEYADFM